MKATHQAKIGTHEDVTAWQFSHHDHIPVWVARRFHLIGGNNWSAVTPKDELVEAKPGDWAVMLQQEVIIVLTNDEFQKCFKSLL